MVLLLIGLAACTSSPQDAATTSATASASVSPSASAAGGASGSATPRGSGSATPRASGSAAPPSGGADLPTAAMDIINSSTYAQGSWSWDMVDLDSGATMYANNADKLNFLGSTTKLFTVGTYLDEFGADHTLETPVYAVGSRSAGALDGNLVLVGSGDFILGGRGVLDGQLQYFRPGPRLLLCGADRAAGAGRSAGRAGQAGR